MKNHPKNIFFNYDKIFSYNAMINFLVAERGCGKTYGALKASIKDYLKNGRKFIYIRRTLTELEEALPSLFDKLIQNEEFPEHSLRVEGKTLYIDNQILGYGLALSTARNIKSNTYTNIFTIIFDEFIIESPTQHYLKKEVNAFLGLIETIMRLEDFRCLMLGNAVTISNPYFDEFNLDKPYGSDYKLYQDGLILVHYGKNTAYQDYKNQTKFGRLIKNTKYGNYAIQNEFLQDDTHFIEKKTGKCQHWSVLVIEGTKIGVWRNLENHKVYLSKDFDPKHPCVIVFNLNEHTESTLLNIGKRSQWVRPVVTALEQGLLRFENQKIKNTAMKILGKMI